MYYFLSFRDPEQNLNLGCCQIKACTADEAITAAHALGIDPGGEVLAFKLKEKELEMDFNRLYTKEEMITMGYQRY